MTNLIFLFLGGLSVGWFIGRVQATNSLIKAMY